MSPELVGLLGGAALLVFAIEELSRSVQYLAGSQFRVWINTFAGNRFAGLLLGFALAILLSSSGAVTVMLVGLANARLLTLAQVFAVTLGASVGTTFIVHLFSFRISEYGLLLIAGGVILQTLPISDRFSRVARGIFYLGLLFFAMDIVVKAGTSLESNELFKYIITYFRDRPLVSLFIAIVLTATLQSSAATIAFVMSLMVAQHAKIDEAFPWVLGANIGTTATALLASLRHGTLGKQAALGHFICKVAGVILCYPFLKYLGQAVVYLGGDVGRQIANAHTLFNIVVLILFFPFIPWGVKLVQSWLPEREKNGPFVFQYLDPRTLETPELALAQAQREILRLADTVEQMVERSILLFERGSERQLEPLKAMDQVVDFLNRGIKLYLTKLSQTEMTPEQVQKEFELLLRTSDLENIGDIVDRNIVELARKMMRRGASFSREGKEELHAFHAKVVECLRLSTAYFNSRDRALSAKLFVQRQQIEDLTLDLSEQHMLRLHQGVKESLDTTSIHLDLIGNLQRVAGLAVNFTRVQGLRGENSDISNLRS